MTEYIRKDHAIRLAESTDGEHRGKDWLVAQLGMIHPADVRPVVPCGQCRWFDDRGYPNPDPEKPELRMGHCRILGRDVQACWFCATGEREGGDAE